MERFLLVGVVVNNHRIAPLLVSRFPALFSGYLSSRLTGPDERKSAQQVVLGRSERRQAHHALTILTPQTHVHRRGGTAPRGRNIICGRGTTRGPPSSSCTATKPKRR